MRSGNGSELPTIIEPVPQLLCAGGLHVQEGRGQASDVRLCGGLALRLAGVPGPGERHAVKLRVEHQVGDNRPVQFEAHGKRLRTQSFEERLNRGSPQRLLVKPGHEGSGVAREKGVCHQGTVPCPMRLLQAGKAQELLRSVWPSAGALWLGVPLKGAGLEVSSWPQTLKFLAWLRCWFLLESKSPVWVSSVLAAIDCGSRYSVI